MPRYIKPVPRFYLHLKKGEYYLFFTLRYANQLVRMPLSEKVQKRYWDSKQMRCRETVSYPDAVEINEKIEKYETEAKDLWREKKGKIDAAEFRREMEYRLRIKDRPNESATDLLTFASTYTKPGVKPGSLLTIAKTAKLIEAYHATGAPVKFEAITLAWIDGFIAFMYARGLTVNYANRIAKAVKQLMKASAGTHHNSIDFLRFIAKTSNVLPVYLTVDELTTWSNVDIPAHLEKYRDLFLIGCYTGLAFREFTSITPDCISTEGRKVITIVREKTGVVVKIPVLKALDAVLQKYGYQSPQTTNTEMNAALKTIARLAGLNRLVTIKDTTGGIARHEKKPLYEVISTHCGRRTFATMFSLLGIDPDTIRASLGHKTELMTRKYIGTEFLAMAENLAKEIESKTNFEFA
ncbi:MAG: hypothetical protein HUU34_16305 [Saprospiraceae bacterium]|nr:hypothetical protein [Saprospiraceae bacterium]